MDRTQISEIEDLIEKHGVSSFKIFMFYGSHGLHGRSDSQRDFLMIGDVATSGWRSLASAAPSISCPRSYRKVPGED
jgi:hypothetical protein